VEYSRRNTKDRYRTDFERRRKFGRIPYNKVERKALEFFDSNKAEVTRFLDNKATDFLIDFIRTSIDYYKERGLNGETHESTVEFKGAVLGQREILKMLLFLKKIRAKKQEARDE